MINPNVPKNIEFGVVKIYRPVGYKKTAMALNHVDSRTRALAQETFIEFNGKMISCTGFRLDGDDLIPRIPKGCHQFIDEKEALPAA